MRKIANKNESLGVIVSRHAASMNEPPKMYESINKGMEVAAYRNKRMDYHAKGGPFTPEVFARAEADVIAKYGRPL